MAHSALAGHDHLGGLPPRVDLDAEHRLGEVLVNASLQGLVEAAHDLSEGGLAVALAQAIAARHGLPQEPVERIKEGGSVNHVFVLGQGTSRIVVRFAVDPLGKDEFWIEQWCARQAAAHGVPTPEVLATGTFNDVRYGIQRFVQGASGDHATESGLWEVLGGYARVINAIPQGEDAPDGLFSRFGRDLPAAWNAHLDYNLSQLDAKDPVIRLGGYPAARQRRLRQTIVELRDVPMDFGLSHGDLATRNLLLPTGHPPVLIDWGCASYGPGPLTDLFVLERAHRDTGSPSTAQMEAFAAGLGIDLQDVRPALEAYYQLKCLDLVRWALAWRADQVDGYVAALHAALTTR